MSVARRTRAKTSGCASSDEGEVEVGVCRVVLRGDVMFEVGVSVSEWRVREQLRSRADEDMGVWGRLTKSRVTHTSHQNISTHSSHLF